MAYSARIGSSAPPSIRSSGGNQFGRAGSERLFVSGGESSEDDNVSVIPNEPMRLWGSEEAQDWHENEDSALLLAYAKADQRVRDGVEQLREKRFSYVAEALNDMVSYPRFSARICKDRYDAIQNGIARPPPELDDDPNARKQEIIDYAARRKRHQEMAMHLPKDQAPTALSNGAAGASTTMANDRVSIKAKEAVGKMHAGGTKPQHETRKQSAVRPLSDRREGLTSAATGGSRQSITPTPSRSNARAANMRSDRGHHQNVANSEATSADSEMTDRPAAAVNVRNEGLAAMLSRKRDFNTFEQDAGAVGSVIPFGRSGMHPPPMPASNQYAANVDDPREIMHKTELLRLLVERGLSRNRDKECKEVLARRLRESDSTMLSKQLQDLLHRRNMPTTGSKQELIFRLAESDARSSRLFKPRHVAIFNRARLQTMASVNRRAPPTVPMNTAGQRRALMAAGAPPPQMITAGPSKHDDVTDHVHQGQYQQQPVPEAPMAPPPTTPLPFANPSNPFYRWQLGHNAGRQS